VRLHARAVELPFEGRGAEALQRVGDAFRGLSEHRLDRLEDLEHKALEAFLAFGERGCRDRSQAAARIAAARTRSGGRSAASRWHRA